LLKFSNIQKMEKVLEETARQAAENTPENAVEYDFDFDADVEYDFEFEPVLGEGYPDIELDENGRPVGCCTPVELLDELDSRFVATFGEEGRRMANARRERWNRKGPHHYKLF
jgi:hypothetical protein